jgi:hypothetical protein
LAVSKAIPLGTDIKMDVDAPKPTPKKRKPAASRSKKTPSLQPLSLTATATSSTPKKAKVEESSPQLEKAAEELEDVDLKRKKRATDARDMNMVLVLNFGSSNLRFGLADGTPMSRLCVVAVRTSSSPSSSSQRQQEQDSSAREKILNSVRKELSLLSSASNPSKKTFSLLDQEIFDQVICSVIFILQCFFFFLLVIYIVAVICSSILINTIIIVILLF